MLTMTETVPHRDTIRRHCLRWRGEHGIPLRCDNTECFFHRAPLVWNGQEMMPILDHKSGNAADNRVENLRLLCPNCDSQQTETRGGANAGRIKRLGDGSYTAANSDGTTDAYVRSASLVATTNLGTPTAILGSPLDRSTARPRRNSRRPLRTEAGRLPCGRGSPNCAEMARASLGAGNLNIGSKGSCPSRRGQAVRARSTASCSAASLTRTRCRTGASCSNSVSYRSAPAPSGYGLQARSRCRGGAVAQEWRLTCSSPSLLAATSGHRWLRCSRPAAGRDICPGSGEREASPKAPTRDCLQSVARRVGGTHDVTLLV